MANHVVAGWEPGATVRSYYASKEGPRMAAGEAPISAWLSSGVADAAGQVMLAAPTHVALVLWGTRADGVARNITTIANDPSEYRPVMTRVAHAVGGWLPFTAALLYPAEQERARAAQSSRRSARRWRARSPISSAP